MTKAATALKQQHLRAEEKRWDDAIKKIKRLLCYANPHTASEPIQQLTARLLTMPAHARWTVLGADKAELCGFRVPYRPIDILEFIDNFVSYYILDDGSPGIGYMRHDYYDGFVPCASDHEDAVPYFHQDIEVLRQQYPDADFLTAQQALEILESCVARHAEQRTALQKEFPEEPADEEDPEEELLAALVKELVG